MKKIILASLLVSSFAVKAQLVQNIYGTGVGIDNGTIYYSANENSFFGYLAGRYTDAKEGAIRNTFVGHKSGNNNYRGYSNTFLGFESGLNNTLGTGNTFSGANSGNSNTTGSYNVFSGIQSGFSNTTGSLNVFTGVNAGFYNLADNNSFYGAYSGMNNVNGTNNSFFGANSGLNNKGSNNSFFGAGAGTANTTGSFNVFNGVSSGGSNINGTGNVFSGVWSGALNVDGNNNTYTGNYAGANNKGSDNVYVGANAGQQNPNGSFNTYIGFQSGMLSTGSNNVLVGRKAGYSETGSQKLYISNSETTTPLIYGDFASNKLGIGGINTFPSTAGTVNVSAYTLFVKGGILTEEVRIALKSGWADYVFASDYKLASLSEVEAFIKQNNHLPNVPSAAEVAENGIGLGDMSRIQQEKIEELTLYLIEQNKKIEELTEQVKILSERK